MARTVDWLSIKLEYMLPYLDSNGCYKYRTLDQLAARWQVSRSALGHHASDEGWFQERRARLRRIYLRSRGEGFYEALARRRRRTIAIRQERPRRRQRGYGGIETK